jgi:hypothetical protein
MINNNLNINLNPTVSLNSINYKSNQHGESFPYELDKIHPKMLQRDGVVMKMMKVLVMMMMIPMKPSSMTMTMAMISPSGEEFPRQISACQRAFSLCVFSAPQRRLSLSTIPLRVLGFWGDDIREGAMAEVGQGGHTTRWSGLGLARATKWCGPWWLTSSSPSSYFYLPVKYEVLDIF